jgi:hypothetical protein
MRVEADGLLTEHRIAHGVRPELLIFFDILSRLFHLTALLDGCVVVISAFFSQTPESTWDHTRCRHAYMP